MELTISDNFLKQLIVLGKFDQNLALSLANEMLDQKEPLALAQHLFTRNVALDLLAQKLQEDPERTIKEIDGLPERTTAGASRRGRRPGRPSLKVSGNGDARLTRKRRRRLSATQVDKIKERIRDYLEQNPRVSRKEIMEAVKIPSPAKYNRIMGEMRDAGEISVVGEKRNAVYSLN